MKVKNNNIQIIPCKCCKKEITRQRKDKQFCHNCKDHIGRVRARIRNQYELEIKELKVKYKYISRLRI